MSLIVGLPSIPCLRRGSTAVRPSSRITSSTRVATELPQPGLRTTKKGLFEACATSPYRLPAPCRLGKPSRRIQEYMRIHEARCISIANHKIREYVSEYVGIRKDTAFSQDAPDMHQNTSEYIRNDRMCTAVFTIQRPPPF